MRKTKRPDNVEFVGFYEAILADYLTIYPIDRLDTVRDNKRIAQELRFRGLAFITLDLPEMGKVLDRSLSEGRLVDHRVPCFGRRWKNSPIPRLFSGLWMRLFYRSGLLREDVDPDVVFFLRTLLYTSKKLNLDCKPERVYDAVKEYYDVESHLPDVSEIWSDPVRSFSGRGRRMGDLCHLEQVAQTMPLFHSLTRESGSESEPIQNISDEVRILAHVQRIAGVLGSSLGFFEPSEIQGRHGPGAVSEEKVRGSKKYTFPTWSPRLESLFPWDYYGVTTVDNFLDDGLPIPGMVPRFEESASRLISVPKTQKSPRLIAAEPTCNQWIQQGLADVLRERVKKSLLGVMIDFHDQNPSRESALAASRHGRASTIDLSSASDRLSCWLVESIFRSNISLLEMLSLCRTQFLRNGIDKKMPEVVYLRKFASMGSALTFPVQSIVFATLALGVGSYLHPRTSLRKLAREVRVFGDDIIVPNTWVECLTGVLHRVGLKVNSTKTFTKGNFRESCGMDAFNGYDVTPAYIRWPSVEPVSRSAVGYAACVNNFFIKGLWRTSAFLENSAHWMRKLPVLNLRAAALGKVTFCRGIDPRIEWSWNHNLQQKGLKIFRITRKRMSPTYYENSNGMMEYAVSSRGNRYSWESVVFPVDHYLSIGELAELPPDESPVLIRRGWVSAELLSSFA